MPQCRNNVIYACKGNGIGLTAATTNYNAAIMGNTIVANEGDGINVVSAAALALLTCMNNIITGHVTAGKYGINCNFGTQAANDRIKQFMDYNGFYNNTNNHNLLSAGAHDVTITADPFVNAAGGDFSLNATAGAGAACKNVAAPTSIP